MFTPLLRYNGSDYSKRLSLLLILLPRVVLLGVIFSLVVPAQASIVINYLAITSPDNPPIQQEEDSINNYADATEPTTMTGAEECYAYNPESIATGSGNLEFGVALAASGCGRLMSTELISLGGEGSVTATLFGEDVEVVKLEGKRGVSMSGEIINEGGPKVFGQTVYIPNRSVKSSKRQKTAQQQQDADTSQVALKQQRQDKEDSPKALMKQAVALVQTAVDDNFTKQATSSAWNSFKTSRECPENTPVPAVISGIMTDDHPNCILFRDWTDTKTAAKSNTHPTSKFLQKIADDYGTTAQQQWSGADFAAALNASLKKTDRYLQLKEAIALGLASATDLAAVGLPVLTLPTDHLPLVEKGAEVSISYGIFSLTGGISADIGIATELEIDHASTTVTFGANDEMPVPLPFDKPSAAIGPYAGIAGYVEAEVMAGTEIGGVEVSLGGAGVRAEVLFVESTFTPEITASLFKDNNASFEINNELNFLDIDIEAYVYYYSIDTDIINGTSNDYCGMFDFQCQLEGMLFGWGYDCPSGYTKIGGGQCQGSIISTVRQEHTETILQYDSDIESNETLYGPETIDISI